MTRRSSPLAAARRYYPGFFGALFLILLRVAIGWHFLYEGTQKILSTPAGKASILAKVLPVPDGPPFSSEGYLRAASGPFAGHFRELGDVESLDKLDPAKLKASWSAEVERFALLYGLDDAQKAKAQESLKTSQGVVDGWFLLQDNRDKVGKYRNELAEVEKVERNPDAMSYQKENARTLRRAAEADRKDLVKEVDAWTLALRDDLLKIPSSEQIKKVGDYSPPPTKLQKVDLLTMWGLTAIGLCLILGLFTPIAGLAGAGYLLGFYLSIPPWPGLPEGITEGHYLYVNKNLIEMFACLVLASTPSGLWVGVDAFLFGWIGRGKRRRLAEAARALAEAGDEPARSEVRPTPQDRRKFKTR